jgi:putative ABC transport system permease protein
MRDSDEGRRITGAEPGPEVDEELAYHLEERVREYVARGMTPEGARSAASARLGDLAKVREECIDLLAVERRVETRRERLHVSWLDFKLGLRMLRRYPGLSLVGVLAMAFAIAIGAAAFEVIAQFTNPRLPFPDSERIVTIGNRGESGPQSTSTRDFVAWREGLRSVSALGASRTIERNLINKGGVGTPISVAEISAYAFQVAGIAPLHGRFLLAADEVDSSPAVVVLSYDLWQGRFGGDPGVVGQYAELGASSLTVVGVMPRTFRFPMKQDAWIPLRASALGYGWGEGPEVSVFGRLSRGATLEEAQAELSTLGAQAAAGSPDTHQRLNPLVRRYADAALPIQCDMSRARCTSLIRASLASTNLFFILFLLLVCANVALLMFARAATREREIVVRSALGASRARIVTQLVTEALALGAVAALIGLSAARLALRTGLDLLGLAGADEIPPWWTPDLSLPSVIYAVGLTVLGAAVAGSLPALKMTRGSGVPSGSHRSLSLSGVWTPVIALQIALTVGLVGVGAYILQMRAGIIAVNPGFATEDYLSVRLEQDEPIPIETYEELERRLALEPRVLGVAFAPSLPGNGHGRAAIDVEGVTGPRRVQTGAVDAAFFGGMGARIVAGRAFQPEDELLESPVVVVNHAFVQEVLGGSSAVGRRIRVRATDDAAAQQNPWHEIVGVVDGISMSIAPQGDRAGFYTPLARGNLSSVAMAVHLREDPASFAPRLRQLGVAIDPALRMNAVRPLDEVDSLYVRLLRNAMLLLAGAGLLVLTISLAGTYAVMSFGVSRRTREIGIRRALGARPVSIVASVIARPLIQVTTGVAIGVGSLVFLEFVSHGVPSASFALIVMGFTSAMFCVCMLACLVPTRRALHIEPTEALRSEC